MPIGEAAVGALLQVVFDKLVFSPGVDLFLKLRGGDDLGTVTRRWNKQLKLIEPVLGDADQKQCYNDAVKTWMEELQDLAYDIEDFLDDFNNDQLNAENSDQLNAENNDQRGIKNMVQGIYASASRASEGLLSPVIQSRIDDITERLQDIDTKIQRLGLSASNITHQQSLQTETLRSQRESTSFISEREVLRRDEHKQEIITQLLQQLTLQPETSESWRESTSLLSQPVVYGMDRKKDEIITQLLKDEQINENFAVIPIVGKGGIGKTTLAQYVYNDEQVNSHFDCKAWMCVSDVFDVKGITTTIFKAVNPGAVANFSSLNESQEKLKQVLTGRKFLIVLDDVWELKYGEWDTLQAPFQYGAKGSRVIMTTRILKSARTMIDDPIHTTIIDLPVLSDNDCWCLFQQHAKGVSELVEKRVIIEKCKGLPLVAKALGGLLKSAGDKTKCQMILNNNIWREESSVLPVLRLSYDHLPSNLKRVFAYCSVYPKDYKFHEMELVLSWMAQGFLPESERMVDVGRTYFFDLVSRSLFEKSPSGRGFSMHDLIHDLAQWAAGGICCAPEFKFMQRDRGRTRHLFLSKDCINETLGNQLLAPQLRTFISPKECYYNDWMDARILDYIQKLKYVRTLDLAFEEIEELPDLFDGLIHLRCLTLSIRKIKVLPKSISKLCNLQTLDLSGCPILEEIPNMSFLVKLRCLKIALASLKEMPLGIGKLTNLQTLDIFILAARGGSRVRELKNLNHLHGRLIISGVGNVIKVEDAQEAQLQKKMNLEELYLYWKDLDVGDDNTARDVVEQLQPPTSIKRCELFGYKGLTFPCWLGDPSLENMVRIRLSKCMRCEYFPPLGQLPKLEILCIEHMRGIKQVDLEFYGSCPTPFPALKRLEFSFMDSWESWVHSPGDKNRAFTRLEELTIYNCKSLQGSIPPHLPSLKELRIETCKKMSVSLPSLLSPEKLIIEGCKEFSIMGDVIFCSRNMWLHSISEISGLHGGFPYLGKELFIQNCPSLINCTLANFTQSSSLKELRVYNCQSLITCELATCTQPSSLEFLEFRGCKNMESLPSQLHNFSSLKKLVIHECPKIQYFPEGGLPKNLTLLYIYEMKIEQPVQEWGLHLCNLLRFIKFENVGSSANSVEHIPCPGFSLPSSLDKFKIQNFQNLKTISSRSTLPNLTVLSVIDCPNLESLFVDHVVLASLTKLKLIDCPNFRFFPKGCLFKNLMKLVIRTTNIETPIKEWGLHLLTSLEDITLEDLGSSSDTIECTSDLHLPSSLRSFSIKGFKNLKTINCSNLPKLYQVLIESCPKFESFGDNGLPSQLQMVIIEGCDIRSCDILQQKLRSDPQGLIWIDDEKYSLC